MLPNFLWWRNIKNLIYEIIIELHFGTVIFDCVFTLLVMLFYLLEIHAKMARLRKANNH